MNGLVLMLGLIYWSQAPNNTESSIVEGARRADIYWNAQFRKCRAVAGQTDAWFGVGSGNGISGSVLSIPNFSLQFRTDSISQLERLNGLEFRATSSLDPGLFRWWILDTKSWRDWQEGTILPTVIISRKRGVWSIDPSPGTYISPLKPPSSCADLPPMR